MAVSEVFWSTFRILCVQQFDIYKLLSGDNVIPLISLNFNKTWQKRLKLTSRPEGWSIREKDELFDFELKTLMLLFAESSMRSSSSRSIRQEDWGSVVSFGCTVGSWNVSCLYKLRRDLLVLKTARFPSLLLFSDSNCRRRQALSFWNRQLLL